MVGYAIRILVVFIAAAGGLRAEDHGSKRVTADKPTHRIGDIGKKEISFVLKDPRGEIPVIVVFRKGWGSWIAKRAKAEYHSSIEQALKKDPTNPKLLAARTISSETLADPGFSFSFEGIRLLPAKARSDQMEIVIVGETTELKVPELVTTATLLSREGSEISFSVTKVKWGTAATTTTAFRIGVDPVTGTLWMRDVSVKVSALSGKVSDTGETTDITGSMDHLSAKVPAELLQGP